MQQLQLVQMLTQIEIDGKCIQYLQIFIPSRAHIVRNMGLVLARNFDYKSDSIFRIQMKQLYWFTSIFLCKRYLVGIFEHLTEETFFPHFFLKVFPQEMLCTRRYLIGVCPVWPYELSKCAKDPLPLCCYLYFKILFFSNILRR